MTENSTRIKFKAVIKDAFLTFLSFFSISFTTIVFGNVLTYIKPLILIGDNDKINGVLAISIFVITLIIYYIQSDDNGYKLEVRRKYHRIQFIISTSLATAIFILISICFFFYYRDGSVPMIIKLLFLPGFYLHSVVYVFFDIEFNMFLGSIVFIPFYVLVRVLGVHRGRSLVTVDRKYLQAVAKDYNEEEFRKRDSWKNNDSNITDFPNTEDYKKGY